MSLLFLAWVTWQGTKDDYISNHLQGSAKRLFQGCKNFLPCFGWVVLIKTTPFSLSLHIISIDAPCNCDGVVGGVSGSSLSAPVAAVAPDALGLPLEAPFAAFFDFEAELLEGAVDDEVPEADAFDCFP